MRLVTWNINSVRLRMDLVARLIQEKKPDILCLQETKCPDDHFPLLDFAAHGYTHTHICGMKSYNGVAILSRVPIYDSKIHHWCGREDCRHISVTLANNVELHNIYVPAGGDVPDPAENEKFAHKLSFVDSLTAWFESNRRRDQKIILVGDLNIAPLPNDVWSHKQLLNVVSHTPPEVERLEALQATLQWCDVMRHFVPAEERLYSWWSYRNRDWKKSNRGRRLDHIWVTSPLTAALKDMQVLSAARDWEKPSDHVPVIATFEDIFS